MNTNLPDNDTGQAIKEIIKNGVNLNNTMSIDFFVVLSNEVDAQMFENEIKKYNFKTSIEFDEELDLLTCYCTKEMFLEYEEIIKVEEQLSKFSSKYDGYYDGFGTFGNLYD